MMNGRQPKKTKPQRGPFKGVRRWLGGLFDNKPFLMVFSLAAALLFWSMLLASDGSLTYLRTFQNVAVGVSGESTLKSRGYIVLDDLEELIPAVKMTVEVSQNNYNRVSGTAYNPHLDLTDITGAGEATLNVAFSSQLYGPVVHCEPASVKVNVERYITKRVPVVLQTTGELEGYYLSSFRADPTTLSVSGPQSLVSRVARAVAVIDVSALSGERLSDKTAVDVRLMDAAGGFVESHLIDITNQSVITSSVLVDTVLLPVKEVPLDLASFVTGTPAEGYELLGVEAAVESFAVAASREALEAIDVITTAQPLNLEGATQDVTRTVRLLRPSSAGNALPADVMITARIGEKNVERTFDAVPVRVENLPDAMEASLALGEETVLLTGGYGFVNGLEAEQIRLYIDVDGLEPGEYNLPVQVRIDNAPAFVCALSSPEIKVMLSERQP